MTLRLAPEADKRIRRAAATSGMSTSAFVQRAASAAADAVLADRREFSPLSSASRWYSKGLRTRQGSNWGSNMSESAPIPPA